MTDLDTSTESLVVLRQFGVGAGESFNLDFVFADFGFVLLFQARDFCLVFGLDFNNCALQLIQGSLAALAVNIL